jgi:hypothetical protein
MRAALPSPSRSCAGKTTVLATDAMRARTKLQWIPSPLVKPR